MSSNRAIHRFNAIRLPKGEDGRVRTGFRIDCACGEAEMFSGAINGAHEGIDTFLIKRFRRNGWYIGQKSQRCPKCASREASLKHMPVHAAEAHAIPNREIDVPVTVSKDTALDIALKGMQGDILAKTERRAGKVINLMPGPDKTENVAEALAEMTASAVPPPAITPDGRRRVFREIDDHWQEGSRCYEGEWSDRRIAATLNVPRAWVAQVRQESFGGPDNTMQVAEIIQALGDKIKAANAGSEKALKLAEAFEELKGDFAALQKRVEALK